MSETELASIQGSHAFVCAADTFSLLAHIGMNPSTLYLHHLDERAAPAYSVTFALIQNF